MKKNITLALGSLLIINLAKAQTFTDAFETYTLTTPELGVQSPDWRTWSTQGGGTEDVAVINTDNHTTGGSQSIYFMSTSSTGGPTDVILPFSTTTPLTTGHFTYTMWMKIPKSKSAYFNFQGTATFGGMYSLDCYLDTSGAISVQNSGSEVGTGTRPVNTWFELKVDVNLNTNNWNLYIDGVLQSTWSNKSNQVYAIDIYPADADAEYWVDDVSYNVVPYTLPALNLAANYINVSSGLTSQTRIPTVTVRNLGVGVINSFDISVSHNGGAPIKQSYTGLTLASLTSTVMNFASSFTLVSGVNTFSATVSNINGLGADGDGSDDMTTNKALAVTPALGKVVVGEEGTGTWCQWCPRGAVYMKLMADKYPSHFAGIAVHNGNNDPMRVVDYDAAFAPLLPGFPSALVDRDPKAIDPSGLEESFFKRVVVAPKAFIKNGATFNTTTRVLDVSVTTTIQTAITGDYKLACVITEDSIRGTASGYNQANAYAGGAAGVMGGFELLANPVPAAKMTYDHVARFISPDFTGIPGVAGTSSSAGTIFTYNFSFTLPANFKSNKIHIIGMFIDPTGMIENAGSATIAEAITNGYVVGVNSGFNKSFAGPDAQINLYPNPTANISSISLDLAKVSNVQVAIYAVDGSLIGNKDYGKLNGAMTLPVDLTKYDAGIYFININIDGQSSVLKLVKK